MSVTEQVQECCDSCGCYAEVGTIIGEGDETLLLPIEADSEQAALAQLAPYAALAKQICAEVVIQPQWQADACVLNAALQFSCTAEKLIFEMRARAL